MDLLELIDELEDIVDKGVSVPLSGRCLLDKDELMEIIEDIKLKLPDDLKQAKWIKSERDRILAEAKAEADKIIKTANEQIIEMVDENEITKKAMNRANDIMVKAQSESKATKDASIEYTDYLLENVERVVTNVLRELEQCVVTVKSNRDELKR
ncbi:MAG: ATPase [Clostridia bacterium]|nr:ATPase [Clostridia bacterium]